MSKKAIKIQKLYKSGQWTKEMVYNTVGKTYGITAEEYEEITGEVYDG